MHPLIALSLTFVLASGLNGDDALEADLGGFDAEVKVSQDEVDLGGFEEEATASELDGFDAIAFTELQEETKPVEKTLKDRFTVAGNVAFKTAYGYKSHTVDGVNYHGINQAQSALYLQVDGKIYDNWKLRVSGDAFYDAIYDIYSDTNYNSDVRDAYETQLRLSDTYIQGRLTNNLDVKIGRQKVVWGKSDSIRVTDVINPTDNRYPGTTDIEDLRLSVGMAKFDYYLGAWNISTMFIAENRIFEEAPVRGEFFPVDAIFASAPNPFLELLTPTSNLDDMQYALALNGVFSGWDLSFYAAHVLDSKWHIDPTIQKRVVEKVDMLGTAINIATGSWLLKSEVAFLHGVKYNSTTDAKNRLDTLVGFDYMGIKDTVLSFEIVNRHIFDYESQMSQAAARADFIYQDEVQTALRATRSFYNDSLNVNGLLSMFGPSWQYGGFARVWAEYDVMDAVVANFGIVDYIGGDKPFVEAIRDNDKVFVDITYSF